MGERRGGVARLRFLAGMALLVFAGFFTLVALSELGGPDDAALVGGLIFILLLAGLPGFRLAFPDQFRRTPWGGLLLLVLGAGAMVGAVAARNADLHFEEHAENGIAIVAADAVEDCSSSREGIETLCSWSAPISYVVGGVEYQVQRAATPAESRSGDQVPIRYNPDDPAEFRVEVGGTIWGFEVPDGDWGYWILGVIGIVMVVGGVVGVRHKIRSTTHDSLTQGIADRIDRGRT